MDDLLDFSYFTETQTDVSCDCKHVYHMLIRNTASLVYSCLPWIPTEFRFLKKDNKNRYNNEDSTGNSGLSKREPVHEFNELSEAEDHEEAEMENAETDIINGFDPMDPSPGRTKPNVQKDEKLAKLSNAIVLGKRVTRRESEHNVGSNGVDNNVGQSYEEYSNKKARCLTDGKQDTITFASQSITLSTIAPPPSPQTSRLCSLKRETPMQKDIDTQEESPIFKLSESNCKYSNLESFALKRSDSLTPLPVDVQDTNAHNNPINRGNGLLSIESNTSIPESPISSKSQVQINLSTESNEARDKSMNGYDDILFLKSNLEVDGHSPDEVGLQPIWANEMSSADVERSGRIDESTGFQENLSENTNSNFDCSEDAEDIDITVNITGTSANTIQEDYYGYTTLPSYVDPNETIASGNVRNHDDAVLFMNVAHVKQIEELLDDYGSDDDEPIMRSQLTFESDSAKKETLNKISLPESQSDKSKEQSSTGQNGKNKGAESISGSGSNIHADVLIDATANPIVTEEDVELGLEFLNPNPSRQVQQDEDNSRINNIHINTKNNSMSWNGVNSKSPSIRHQHQHHHHHHHQGQRQQQQQQEQEQKQYDHLHHHHHHHHHHVHHHEHQQSGQINLNHARSFSASEHERVNVGVGVGGCTAGAVSPGMDGGMRLNGLEVNRWQSVHIGESNLGQTLHFSQNGIGLQNTQHNRYPISSHQTNVKTKF